VALEVVGTPSGPIIERIKSIFSGVLDVYPCDEYKEDQSQDDTICLQFHDSTLSQHYFSRINNAVGILVTR
jgi:hypothetical protein